MSDTQEPRGPYAAQPAPEGGGGGVAVALYHPLIPNNTGNIARTCVATMTPLYLIKPFPFSLDESRLRRAGLDYWKSLRLGILENLEPLRPAGRLVFVSRKGSHNLFEYEFRAGDRLVFGPEDTGFTPGELAGEESVYIPMEGPVRSLNLSNAVAITLFHALHTLGRPGGPGDPGDLGPRRAPLADDGGIGHSSGKESAP